MPVVFNRDAVKRILEQAPGSPVGLVDAFCICVEKIGKGMAGGKGFGLVQSLISDSDFFFRFYPDRQVEVVFQQAVCESLGYGRHVPGVQSQEIRVIARLDKNVFPIVAAIEDMVIGAILQAGWAGHGCVFIYFFSDPNGLGDR